MFKIILLFAIVLCALAVQGANLEEDSQNLGNKVDDLLRKLKEKVDAAVAKAQAALDAAKAKINQIASQIQGAAKKEMQSSVDNIRAEIDKLKLKAKNAGVNIDECLAGNEDKLLGLPDKFSGDMVHCVTDRINEGIGYAQDGLNQIKKIVDEVENIKTEIKDCGHGWKAAKCLAKLALKIESDITTLPAKIEADIAATVVLINKLEEKIKKCASDKTGECETEGKAILEKRATVADNKHRIVLGNEVDDKLKKLREKVDAAVQKAQAELDAAKAKVNAIAAQFQEDAKKAMQSSIDSFRSKIDEMKCKAKDAGVNIDSCLGKNEEDLLALPNKFSGDMVHCVSDRINEAIGHVQCALDKIKNLVDEIENLKKEIHDCGHGWKGAKCLAELAEKIERHITTLPTSIEAEAAAAVVLITQLEEKVKECASGKTNDCESEGKTILEKITFCVAGKMVIT